MRVFAIFQSLRYLFILFVLSYFISISLEGEKLAAIFSIAEFLLFIILVLDLFLNLKLSFSKNCFEWIKIHILYGLKASVGGVFIEMNSRIDVLMIGIFLSDKYVGIYSFAALFAEGFYQLFVVLQNLYNPIIAKLISSNKIGELIITISQARKIIMPTAIFLGSVGIILFKNLIKLSFFSNDLEISFLPFVILIAGSVLASGYIPFLNILTMADFPIWNSILIAYTVIANVFLNLYLIPNFGLNGAAIATSIALCSSTFILKIISKKLLRINF